MTGLGLIMPDWPAPPGVLAVSTTRLGGVSEGIYRSLNLGDHVGDRPDAVAENRRRLVAACDLTGEEPGVIRSPRAGGGAARGFEMRPLDSDAVEHFTDDEEH